MLMLMASCRPIQHIARRTTSVGMGDVECETDRGAIQMMRGGGRDVQLSARSGSPRPDSGHCCVLPSPILLALQASKRLCRNILLQLIGHGSFFEIVKIQPSRVHTDQSRRMLRLSRPEAALRCSVVFASFCELMLISSCLWYTGVL